MYHPPRTQKASSVYSDPYQYGGHEPNPLLQRRLLEWEVVAKIYNKKHPKEPVKMTKQNAHRICVAALKKLRKAFFNDELEAT